MLDKQKIFTKVKKHLLKQKKKSIRNGSCKYYNSDGTKCAIGCLISKKLYKPQIETRAISSFRFSSKSNDVRYNTLISVLKKSLKSSLDEDDIQFLEELQQIHDCYEPYAWKKELSEFAESHNLEM